MTARRVLLFTGKGGTGASTLAAATAVTSAAGGARTLLAGLGEPGSLARVVGLAPSHAVQTVAAEGELGLFDEPWNPAGDARSSSGAGSVTSEEDPGLVGSPLLEAMGIANLAAEEAAALPGFGSLAALARLAAHLAEADYDLLVLDAGAMAEGLRPLGWLDLLASAPGEALPRLRDFLEILQDGSRTSARLVAAGEPNAAESAREAAGRLSLLGVRLGAVIVNRLFVPSVASGYLGAWAGTQSRVTGQLREAFPDVPVWPCWLQPEEVVGAAALQRLADDLYAGRDVASGLPGIEAAGREAAAAGTTDAEGERGTEGRRAEAGRRGSGARRGGGVEVAMPFVDPAQLSAFGRDDGVALVAHRFRRQVASSGDELKDAERATWQDGRLRIE